MRINKTIIALALAASSLLVTACSDQGPQQLPQAPHERIQPGQGGMASASTGASWPAAADLSGQGGMTSASTGASWPAAADLSGQGGMASSGTVSVQSFVP